MCPSRLATRFVAVTFRPEWSCARICQAFRLRFETGGPTGVFDATVTFTNTRDASGSLLGTGSLQANLANARGVTRSSWSSMQPHRVRSIPGPSMSEFHYFVPTADAHTHVWFFVRAYSSGDVEVETVVENGWLLVPSPGSRTYDVTVDIAGSRRLTATAVTHPHHARWSRVDWSGLDPEVTPRFDAIYLQSIEGMPRLAVSSLEPEAYSDFPESGPRYTTWTRAAANQPSLFGLGNIDPALGSGGFTDNANLFAAWDMTFLVEGDPRALWAIWGNARAGGRFSVHYRDESTGGVARGSSHLSLCLDDTNVGIDSNAGNCPSPTPAPTGAPPSPNWFFSHGPSLGFLAYLTSGRWSAWDELQFFSAVSDFQQTGNVHQGYRISPWWDQLRSHAWKLRSRAQAATAAPAWLAGQPVVAEDLAQRREALGRLESDIAFYHSAYVMNADVSSVPRQVSQNPFGLWYQHQDYDGTNDNRYTVGGMMQAYNALVVMWALDAQASDDQKLRELAAFSARFPIGMLGGSAPTWDYRVFTFYQAPFGNGGLGSGGNMGPVSLLPSWSAVWNRLTTDITWRPTHPFPLPADSLLRNFTPFGNSTSEYQLGSPQSELALGSSNAVASAACVAYAHQLTARLSLPGASTMSANFYQSATWRSTVLNSFRRNPQWAYKSKLVP